MKSAASPRAEVPIRSAIRLKNAQVMVALNFSAWPARAAKTLW